MRGWLTRMAAALRDEPSGICFRDLHGFATTGSQISWIPPAGGQAATLRARGCNPLCARLQPYVAASSPGYYRPPSKRVTSSAARVVTVVTAQA